MTTNEIQIKELVENWVAAVKTKNIAGILVHHDSEIVMFDVPPPFQSIGIVEYRKTWDIFFGEQN